MNLHKVGEAFFFLWKQRGTHVAQRERETEIEREEKGGGASDENHIQR